MSEAPVVLVVATQRSLVDKLVQDLRAHGLMSFGTTSGEDSARSVGLLQPEVVVIDPTSDECSALLNNFDTSSRSLRLVAIAESAGLINEVSLCQRQVGRAFQTARHDGRRLGEKFAASEDTANCNLHFFVSRFSS